MQTITLRFTKEISYFKSMITKALLHREFLGESVSEEIFRIGLHLQKLCPKIQCTTFSEDGYNIYHLSRDTKDYPSQIGGMRNKIKFGDFFLLSASLGPSLSFPSGVFQDLTASQRRS